MTRFFLLWSWRDLRRHWVAVVAIALVLAIGTGIYAGLGSTATWRRSSNDASFAVTGIHDLRVALSPGTFVAEGELRSVVDGLPEADRVTVAAERLVVDSQVDASTPDDTVLVRSRVVGMTFGASPVVDDVWLRDGVVPTPGAPVPEVVLESKFVDFHDLPLTGTVELAGATPVAYVGTGIGPEDFYVTDPEGAVFAQGDYAIVYADLADAQRIAGRSGEVNDLVLRLVPGTDRDAVAASLESALGRLDGVSATVSTTDDVDAHRVLYEDIENDQQVWNLLSGLVLLAAAVAAFNLVTRIVEAQRREIGIGMALGVPRRRLAIRPLLVGVQIGLLGTVAGIGVGLLAGEAMKGLMESLVPLPRWETGLRLDIFARAAVLGFGIPVAAAMLPVWRAVRVEPIEAIRTGHLTARSSRLTDWTNRIRLPGSSLTHLPIRNVARNPRRTLLTAVGVGAAITALVAVLGMLDSIEGAIDRGRAEVTKGDPERVVVQLDTFRPVDGDVVQAVTDREAVGVVDPGLRLPAFAAPDDDPDGRIDFLLQFLDLDGAEWTPTVIRGEADPSGILLAEKAADDLGVAPGDTVALLHPVATADGGYGLATTEVPVAGIHPNPIRNVAYADLALADTFGFGGQVNVLDVHPAPGYDRGDVQRAVFSLPGVASTQPVARLSEIFDEAMQQFVGFLFIVAGAVLVLAVLIAFNSSRITVEERQREHATMRAFGLPIRSVMAVVMKESVIVGIVASGLGLIAGRLILGWMLRNLAEKSLPDFGIAARLDPSTLVIALVVGVVAVGIAPLFLVRRVQRMNLPDTLRVME